MASSRRSTDFWASTKSLILPVVCLATFPIAGCARQTRTSMLEVMNQDYVRTAWSKGLSERIVIVRHALKNALAPVMTMAGMQLGGILGGSVIVEKIFVIPGMGLMAVRGVLGRTTRTSRAWSWLWPSRWYWRTCLVDISYGWFDPRIRIK